MITGKAFYKTTKLAILGAALCAAATTAQAATQIYWVGGTGGSEAEPLELYNKANWNTKADGSGNAPGKDLSSEHALNISVGALTYLTNSNPKAATVAICENWKFTGGDSVVLGDMCFNALYLRGNSSVTKKGNWILAERMTLNDNADNEETVFVNSEGTLTVPNFIYVGEKSGAKASLVIEGGEVSNTAYNTSIGDVAGSTGTVTVKTGGKLVCSSTYYNYNVKVGGAGTGALNVEGGVVDATGGGGRIGLCVSSGATADAQMNITDKGQVTAKQIAYGNGSGRATMTINDGTVKAFADGTLIAANDNLFVYVGANGGTIDADGKAVTIAEPLLEDSGSTGGGMTFKGGGSVALSSGNTYTGMTTVEVGTLLVVPAAIAGSSLTVTVPEGTAAGVYEVACISGDGVFAEGAETVITCADANASFAMSSDRKRICCLYGIDSSAHVWIGPADGSLSEAANWLAGAVPESGNAYISCGTAATLSVGDSFRPAAITFAAGSAAVTIDGSDLTGVVAVTNLASSSHTINAKVYFAGDIQVKQAAMADTADLAKPHVTFAGGAYAAAGCSLENNDSDAVYSRCVFGKYYLGSTAESPWSAMYDSGQKRVCVADGAELHVPYADNLTELYVGTGAHVFVGELAAAHDQRASYQDYGEMVVSNLVATGSGNGTRYFYMTHSQGTSNPAVFKFNSVTNDLSAGSGALFTFADNAAAGKHVFYIGEGGVNYKDSTTTIFVLGRDADGNRETIRPWYSDFTVGARPGGSAGLRMFRDVEFCTDDENGTGRTITLEARTQVQANKTAAITVSGKGTLKVTQPADNGAQPTVTLTDTATLEYMTAAATLGTGTVTLGDSTTFAFVNSGNTLKLPAPIAIPDTGTATLRIDGTRLKGGVDHVLMDTAPDGWDASDPHLAITGTALDGRRYTLAEKDGSLVFNIAPTGLSIIIR